MQPRIHSNTANKSWTTCGPTQMWQSTTTPQTLFLNVHSDASHLSAKVARSHTAGYYFLGSIPQDNKPIHINRTIHITSTILWLVTTSATEAKLGALFYNTKEAKIIRLTLNELGHLQPPT
ncbi:hypothetical protein ACHAWX_000073, partial [Stephanocyclus meneghinianus]